MTGLRVLHAPRASGLYHTALALIAALVCSTSVLAADAVQPKISAGAAKQIQALTSIKTTKTAQQNKIDSRLYLGLLHQRSDSRLATLTDFRFITAAGDGRVAVDILLTGANGVKPVVNLLDSLGEVVTAKSFAYHTVTARVRMQNLDALAAITEVRTIRQSIPGIKQAVNTSQGDLTHGAHEARGYFGVTGAGVKVCVLSDGVDSLATLQASGDLPASVNVLPGQQGSGDEGSAMLEIVHDLAPGATLGFATAATSETTFATNIASLVGAGCNVIVDDYNYMDESPFEDGPVAQAVNAATAAGVIYFSAAGDNGNKDAGTSGTWEGDFLATAAADPAPLAGANLHNFGDGGNSILVAAAGTPVMIWAEHYDLSSGTASTDYDLYDMDGGLTTIFDASTNVQDGAGGDDFAIETIGGGTFTGERLLIDKFASGTTSSAPMLNLTVFKGKLDATLATSGATRGHSSATDAFSVAATPVAAALDGTLPAGPSPGLFTSANVSESFTSDGPRRILLDTSGAELTPGNRTSTGGVIRQKPDITAADGVSTASPGYGTFYGTSAAAPHAAAIAALLKSAVPSLTPAQVRTALVSSAIDIQAAGTDRDTGAGIVMAHAALQAVGATQAVALSAGTAVQAQMSGDGDVYVENNETWALTIPLTNNGGISATAVSAVLSSTTPGISVGTGTSAYADLAAGGSGNNATPFSFHVGSAAPCGGSIDFTLTVSFAEGDPQVFTFSVQTGEPGTPVTTSYTGAAVAIPDSAGADVAGTAVLAPLAVSGITGNVYSTVFSIDGSACNANAGATTVGIDHSFVNDLQISLISPSSTSVLLINRTDGGGNNFCQTVLDDSAGTSIQSVATALAPFTGTFKPNAPLSGFRGQNPNGTWNLQAQDFFVGDTGNIRAFSVTVTPAVCNAPPPQLTITANNQTKVYGSALPVLTVSYSGFVNGDTAANLTTQPTINTTATSALHVAGNPYAITASGAVDPDYTIVYVAGSLNVVPAPLTITANEQTKVYGSAIPVLTAGYSGFVNGDTAASLTVQPTINTTATAASHVAGSPYAINASGAVDPDYTISYVVGSLDVTPAPLTITADDQTRAVGQPDPTFTVTYSGLVNGDSSASLATPPTVTSNATATSPAGPYTLTPSGAVDSDYAISYANGTLLITAGTQTTTFTSTPPTETAGATVPYTVSATASSGLAVTFSIDPASTPGTCSIAGNTVSFVAAGTCIVDADQAGDGSFSPAPRVQQTIIVGAARALPNVPVPLSPWALLIMSGLLVGIAGRRALRH